MFGKDSTAWAQEWEVRIVIRIVIRVVEIARHFQIFLIYH